MVERRKCTVEGCPRLIPKHHSRYCPTHRWRLKHHGDVNWTRTNTPAIDRFWAKVDKSGSCWLWTAGKRGDGYGAFRADDLRGGYGAHRFSYELANGPIPDGLVVMHSCDRPLCVNPDHLSVGTVADNAADAARKARHPRGSHNHQSKLTEGQVLGIRAEYVLGGITQTAIAERYGISPALVSHIITRKAWKHI